MYDKLCARKQLCTQHTTLSLPIDDFALDLMRSKDAPRDFSVEPKRLKLPSSSFACGAADGVAASPPKPIIIVCITAHESRPDNRTGHGTKSFAQEGTADLNTTTVDTPTTLHSKPLQLSSTEETPHQTNAKMAAPSTGETSAALALSSPDPAAAAAVASSPTTTQYKQAHTNTPSDKAM